MRILFVGRNAKIGGGTTFRLNIARGLRARGHEIWLASQPGEVLPRYREVGVHYVWTPPAPWGGPWIEYAIRKHRIDLVHASNTTPGRAAYWAAQRTNTPLVMTVHGLLPRRDAHHECWKRTLKIMTFEEMAVKRLSEHVGMIDMGKVELLRRPIEHRPHFPETGGPFRIVKVGRMSKRKGQNALNTIQAFAEFRKAVPESTLDLLGDGSQIGEVRRAAAEYNRAAGKELVRVLGAVPNPVPIMGGAHVVIGASYCALESIMQGVAVIGVGFWGYGVIDQDNLRDAMAWNFGDVGGTWEMSPGNILQALRHLESVWSSGQDRERYWRLDRLIEEDHALERVAGRIEAIYEDVLRGVSSSAVPAAAY